MSKHDELILAAEALLSQVGDSLPHAKHEIADLRLALSAAKAAQAERGEPMAWLATDPDKPGCRAVALTRAEAERFAHNMAFAGKAGAGWKYRADHVAPLYAHPTPAAPDRGEMERVARETLRLLLADLSDRRDGFDIASFDSDVQDEIRVAHEAIINRAVAAATRGQA